jgi:WD40 repeat protein
MLSPTDPQHLISISDEKVWQWGANGCQIRPPFDGSHAAFSSDGAQFVSCFKKTITVHNSSSGAIVTEFQVVDDAHRCCFSPDNGLVAVAAGKTAYCWDITTSEPQLVETFIGHTGYITSLVFSSSTTLISASEDKSVKFWQIGAQSTDPPTIDLKPTSLPSASIKSVTLQSKEGIAITSDSGGVIKTWDISTGICKTSFQSPAQGSSKWDAQLINGRLIFVWYRQEGPCMGC